MQSSIIRAMQHLLIQEFTIYPCSAAVCSRIVAASLLDDSQHTWAIVFDANSLQWCVHLKPEDRLHSPFTEAALLSANPKTPYVLCHTLGNLLTLPLEVTDVREARMKIESAITLGQSPPRERLEAYPEELLEREIKRREALRQSKQNQNSK